MTVQSIQGNWRQGWTLDAHTISSVPCAGGFQTTRTALGQQLYLLKYRADRTQVAPIGNLVATFVKRLPVASQIAAVIPVPASTARSIQPVAAIASRAGALLGLPSPGDYLVKARQTVALKNVTDPAARAQQLTGSMHVVDQRFAGRVVLLLDDLYRSGATLNAAATALMAQGNVAAVYALALTRTRTIR